MAKFTDLKFSKHPHLSGRISRIRFSNGYGASVVSHEHSYGGEDGLYELAVLDKSGAICYTTPITNNVLGYLSEDKVEELLNLIENLPSPQ